jgi:hypothetical protein
VSIQYEPEVLLICLHYRGLCCTWTYLDNSSLSCFWTVTAIKRPVSYLDVPGQQEPELLLDFYYTIEACTAPGRVYTTEEVIGLAMRLRKLPKLSNYQNIIVVLL